VTIRVGLGFIASRTRLGADGHTAQACARKRNAARDR